MEKEFVPYELAVKLKALGFDEEGFGYYHVNVGYTKGYAFCYFDKPKRFKDGFDLLAPTFSQAFRWYREEYGYWSYVKEATKGTCRFYIEKFDEKFFNSDIIDTYEEAELACLEKLIEIVETP
jgi:hypothetical protein